MSLRVLIVDDHRLFADALGLTLREKGMEVLDVATSGREALEAVSRSEPDVVLMDLGLPDTSGITVGRKIVEDQDKTKVLALTGFDDSRSVSEAIGAGFHGYLTKDTSLHQLVTSINASLSGQTVMPHRLARAATTERASEQESAHLLARQLTPREREVLALLVEGENGDGISRTLQLSRNTVRTHIQSILTKLQVHSRLEAVAFAVRHKVVQLPGPADRKSRL